MTAIEWRDILGWERATCWVIAQEVCRRAGLILPSIGAYDRARDDLGPAIEEVAAPNKIGDLIAADPTKKGYASHVAVVVEPGYALSATVVHGPYCWPIARMPHDRGYWRVRQ